MSTCGLDVVNNFVDYFTNPDKSENQQTPSVELKILEMNNAMMDPSPLFDWVSPHMNEVGPASSKNGDAIKPVFVTVDEHVERWNTILAYTLHKSNKHIGPILASNTVNIFAKWLVYMQTYLKPALENVWVSTSTPSPTSIWEAVTTSPFKEFDDFGRFANYPEPVSHPCSRWVIQLCALAALEVLTETRLVQFTRGVFGFQVGMITCESPHALAAKRNMALVRMGNSSAFQLRDSGITSFSQTVVNKNITSSEDLMSAAVQSLNATRSSKTQQTQQSQKQLLDLPKELQAPKEGGGGDVMTSTFWSHVKAPHTVTDERVIPLRLLILWNCGTLLQLLKLKIMPGVGTFSI
jgi:hypothetical protein